MCLKKKKLTKEEIIEDYKSKYIDNGAKGPYETAGWFSLQYFNWMTPMLELGTKVPLQQDMHYNLPEKHNVQKLKETFQENWNKSVLENAEKIQQSEYSTERPSILQKTVWKTYKAGILSQIILTLISTTISTLNTWLLYESIKGFNQKDAEGNIILDQKNVIMIISALIFSGIFIGLFDRQLEFYVGLLTTEIKMVTNAMIVSKAQKKPIQREKQYSAPAIINLASSDTSKLSNFSNYITNIIVMPVTILQNISMLFFMMGYSVFPAMLCLFVALSINALISRKFITKFRLIMKQSDERIKKISEAICNIRYIKMSAMENFFIDKICNIKQQELDEMRKQFLMTNFVQFVNQLSPIAFMISLIGFSFLFGNSLEMAALFGSMRSFNKFRMTMREVPFTITRIFGVLVSTERINDFLLSEEVDDKKIKWVQEDVSRDNLAIEVKNKSFYWVNPKLVDLIQEKADLILLKSNQGLCEFKFCKKSDDKKVKKDGMKDKKGKGGKKKEFQQIENENSKNFLSEALYLNENESEQTIDLSNISQKIPKGACVALIGKVGSGKTSILNSQFGELYNLNETQGQNQHQEKDIYINGSVAYVSQKAWIESKSIKDNILFYKDLDESLYKSSIESSALSQDLAEMIDGDRTILGDKGINLSGGQKIRLSIARAVYADADIYLLDDPISALDIHVGKYVVEECLMGKLKGKTRVVATHAIGFLPYFDYIYILEEGKIVDEGNYQYIKTTQKYADIIEHCQQNAEMKRNQSLEDELQHSKESKRMADLESPVAPKKKSSSVQRETNLMIETHISLKQEQKKKLGNKDSYVTIEEKALENPNAAEEDLLNPKEDVLKKTDGNVDNLITNIISIEDRNVGSITLRLVKSFIMLAGGYMSFIIILLIMLVNIFLSGLNIIFLQHWASQPHGKQDPMFYLGIYALLNLSQFLFSFIRGFVNFFRGRRVAINTNFYMLLSQFHASVTNFWDRIPIGRVLNRFTQDQRKVDKEITRNIDDMLLVFFNMWLDFFMSTWMSSQFLWFFIILYFGLCWMLYMYKFIPAQRELTRLDSISRSPVIQAMTEAFDGVSTIRMFNKQDHVEKYYYKQIDEYYKCMIMGLGGNRWFLLRMDLFSLVIIIPGLFFCIYNKSSQGTFAVLLNYLMGITGHIANFMMRYNSFQQCFISFERCKYFIDIEPEEGYQDLDLIEKKFLNGERIIVENEELRKAKWLCHGKLEFLNYSCRYRKELGDVLKNISQIVEPGKKVGIVGRTGAGKTTFLNSIFRNFDEYEGEIRIDGHEISSVDLKKLRSSMTIIPQDPQLFQNSLKNNIDPYNEHTDEAIIEILKRFEIWDEKFAEQSGLEFKIEDSGRNLSQGEKQLLCMVRALQSQNKLILLDEATANIDIRTESLIQKALETQFSDCTIIMIAHRLNTIMFCDDVLVLEKGEVLEYGSVEKLKNNSDSHFGGMLSKADEIQEALI